MDIVFKKESEGEVKEILQKHAQVAYFSHLQNVHEKKKDHSLAQLIKQGLHEVSETEDPILADYFFILSEIEGVPDKVRDFLMDTMLWCEECETYKGAEGWKNTNDIKTSFQKYILPLLS